MDKKKLILIGKWVAMALLASINFLFYSVNGTMINIILTMVIFVYSIYEFFHALSEKKLHLGIKMYLFTFYLFAVISLFLGVQNLMVGNLSAFLISWAFIGGDIALILYTLHKTSNIN